MKTGRTWVAVLVAGMGWASVLGAENVLLISVDTLRADRLGCYGYAANPTPAIDRWASEGIRFSHAYTVSPLTLPAHASVLTGTYPMFHGIRDNVGYRLADSAVSMAEIFRERGYRTGAVIGAYVLASPFGTSQGFDDFDDDFGDIPDDAGTATSLQRPAAEVARRSLEWLERNRDSRFFLFVHFYDPHLPRPDGYDAEVSRVDGALESIDRFLRSTGLLDRTHILVFGDHGEGLGDHGESAHGFFLYNSTLHVPLVIRPAASIRPQHPVSTEVVSLVDVMPTLLQLAGLAVPSEVQGRSLVRSLLGRQRREEGAYAETWVPWTHFGWSPLRTLILGPWKYVDAPDPELYQLAADPAERNNLAGNQTAVSAQYRDRLTAFYTRFLDQSSGGRTGSVSEVDAETRERLAALGYVAVSGGTVGPGEFGQGIDPKLRIGAFEKHTEILADLADRRVSPHRLQELGELRRMAPEMRGLDFLEAGIRDAAGDPAGAERVYTELLAREPDHHLARANRATLLLARGAFTEAEQEFRDVIRRDPADFRARNNLASLYLRQGRIEPARSQLEEAVRANPGYFTGWYNLGVLHIERQEWAEAEQALQEAVRLREDSKEAHFHLAVALNALGRLAEAERHLEQAKP